MNDYTETVDELTELTLEREVVVSLIQAHLDQIPDRLDDVYGRIPDLAHMHNRLDSLFPRLINLNIRIEALIDKETGTVNGKKKSFFRRLIRK